MDLIDREQLMNYIRSRKINIGKLAHDVIMKQPSIQLQEPKTEHWIRKSYLIPIKTKKPPTVANGIFREVTTTCKYRYTYTCSKCGGNEYFEKYSYCPQCGAKMESEVIKNDC